MSTLFLKVLNLSIAASWLILAVVVIRLFLKNAPKWIRCVLWALVAFRLACPVTIESPMCLVPSNETIPYDIAMKTKPMIDSGIKAVDQVVNPVVA